MPEVIVVYDACVLYPAPLRDLLIRLALTGYYQAKWSEDIHREWMHNLLKDRPDLKPEPLQKTRQLMDAAVPDCLVAGYEARVAELTLPDEGDRHVLAAAIHAGASLIVTFNLADFPDAILRRYGVRAQHPDEFVASLIALDAEVIIETVERQRRGLRNPPKTRGEHLETLLRQGLVRTAAALRALGYEARE